jgi:transcriptional regulator with XRE-family HTH domain
MSTKSKKVNAKKYLAKKYGPMTFGLFLRSMREADDLSLAEFASKLDLSRANLCDIEKGRKIPSPERAARIAKDLGVPEKVLIQLAIQDTLRCAKLHYDVEIKKAS